MQSVRVWLGEGEEHATIRRIRISEYTSISKGVYFPILV